MTEAAENAQAYKLPAVIPQPEPEPAPSGPSNRRTIVMVSLAALSVLGAAVSSLQTPDRLAWPNLDLPSLPSMDRLTARISWPDFWPEFSLPDLSWPDFSRVAAKPPQKATPPVPPHPMIVEALTEIQVAQRQSASVLAALTENAAAQQAELKKLSRQVTLVSVQMDSLRGTVTFTSSIPAAAPSIAPPTPPAPTPSMFSNDDPMTASINPSANASARMVRPPSRKTTHAVPAAPAAAPASPPITKPLGPVSVGGAPLGQGPAD